MRSCLLWLAITSITGAGVLAAVGKTQPGPVATPMPTLSVFCDCSADTLNCSNFTRQSEAQECHDFCMAMVGRDVHRLDGNDQDRLACESLP